VSGAELDYAVNQIVENPLPQMIFAWNSLSDIEHLAISIMAEIADGPGATVGAGDIRRFAREKRIGLAISRTALNEALERLFLHDILLKDAAGTAYAFRMDLWRVWIARMHSVWEITDTMKEAGSYGEGITPLKRRRSRRRLAAILAVTLAVAAFVIGYVTRDRTESVVEDTALPAVDTVGVSFATSPPGAEVIVDGSIVGVTPIETHPTPAQPTAVMLRLAGYKVHRDTIDFRVEENRVVAVDLIERTGSIRLTSSPAGATVHIDGERLEARTPAVIENLPVVDFYDIRLTMAGYQPVRMNGVQVIEDSVITRHHDFNRLMRQVQIVSTPDAAEIHIDGRLAGLTPDFFALAHGTHWIELRKAGYEGFAREVNVPGDGERIEAALVRLAPGVLVVMVRPWADVYVDGELVGSERTNLRVPLHQGRYTVRLVNPHFPEREKTIDITAETEWTWECDLRTEDSP
jgi:hypothetical protein